MKRTLAVPVALLAIAGAAAGCGGGTSSGGGTTAAQGSAGPALSKGQFIAKADGFCKAADGKLATRVGAFAAENKIAESGPSRAQELQIVSTIVVPSLKLQEREIAALSPPQGDGETIETIVSSLAKGIEEAEADPTIISDGGESGFTLATEEAHAYGMKFCGSPG